MRWLKTKSRGLILVAALIAIGAIAFGGNEARLSGQARPGAALYEGARLIVGDGSAPIESSAFLVENGRFTEVGRKGQVKAPAGAAHVDLTGKTVMPAIVDAHTHPQATREGLTEQLQRAAYYGVTAMLSLGTDPGDLPYQMREETKTMPNTARFFTAGRGIVWPDGGPGRSKIPYEVTTEEAARAAVRELAPKKPDFVKIWVDDRMGTVGKMPPAMFGAVIDEAHKNKLRVAAHIYNMVDGKALLRSPQKLDVFAHLVRDADVDDEFIALLKQHPDVYILPNLPPRGVTEEYDWLSETLAPEAVWRLKDTQMRQTPEQIKAAQEFYGFQSRNLLKYSQAGAKIGFGTDGSSAWTAHTEMADMVAAGLTPNQVLTAATKTAAEIIGVPDLGMVAKEKSADFLVLDANPLDNILNTRKINAFYQRGALVDRAGLRSKWVGPQAKEIVIYSPASVQQALMVLGPDFTKATGTKVTYSFSSGGVTNDRVRAGAPVDMVVLAIDALDPLAKGGFVRPETIQVIGTVRTGIAVKTGSPMPDISTVAKFKETLLAARSVSYQNPAGGSTSGAQIAKIVADLGIADQLKPKLKFVGGAGVANGDAEMHFQPVSELMPVQGITIGGLLPPELGATSDIAAGIGAHAPSPELAQAFIRYLKSAEAQPTFKLKGVFPPPANTGSK